MEGRNVLQVAIKHGHVKIVKIIAEMIKGPNPVLPSWLLSDVKDDEMTELPSWLLSAVKDDDMNEDNEKNNTILHFAAGTTRKGEGSALEMQREIKWFEVRDIDLYIFRYYI